MTPRYGWAGRSERCPGKAPHGHWNTSTFIGALRYDGLQAPWLIDGPINGDGFIAYLEHVLTPTLKLGDIVICDNLSSHKVAREQEIVEQAGASLIYLPPYSPDLNPIENAFSKLKSCICRASARTFEQLLQALDQAIDKLTKQDCSAYFKHAKYRTI
ncbi:IS630 family transposase [Cerasicoccus arenae]|uniref:IS630 family transposase n=2 Tax=Cerasicoccus arenae TaxID=424488 RepID=A0A8J3DFE9_9BACT|nr:IS630 family transposase [Cerasicoccus arenae]